MSLIFGELQEKWVKIVEDRIKEIEGISVTMAPNRIYWLAWVVDNGAGPPIELEAIAYPISSYWTPLGLEPTGALFAISEGAGWCWNCTGQDEANLPATFPTEDPVTHAAAGIEQVGKIPVAWVKFA